MTRISSSCSSRRSTSPGWALAATVLAHALTRRSRRIEELASARGLLVAEALDAAERERKRLAEALHDETVQNLLAAGQELDEVERGDAQALDRVRDELRRSVRQLRDAILDLHPYVLERAGLAAAVRSLVERERRRGNAMWSVRVDDSAAGAHDRLVLALARELVHNAVKHSGADRIDVDVAWADGDLVLAVTDDGRGFDPERADRAVGEGHVGLASCRERVESVGGALEIASLPGAGTTVRARIPRA